MLSEMRLYKFMKKGLTREEAEKLIVLKDKMRKGLNFEEYKEYKKLKRKIAECRR